MIKKVAFTGVFALLFSSTFFAQQTTVFTEANLDYKRGMDFFDQGIYGLAMNEFGKSIQKLRPVNEPEAELLLTKAELNYAKSAVRLELPDGEKLMLDFIRKHSPDPISNQALIDVADYYFDARKYDKAIEFYKMAPTYQMASRDKAEVYFKLGYAYFVQKNFNQAKRSFYPILQLTQSDYFHASHYYYGMCEFFEGNYDSAIKSFKMVEDFPKYKPHIPYYLAQIYFAQGKYDELISYGESKLQISNLRNDAEIRQLIGQAYFEKEDYVKALPHLEYYAERSSTMREEEFYQLGIAQYKTGNYQKAIKNLEQLNQSNSKIGQHAMSILADCYLKSGNKGSARNAFLLASKMDFDAALKEDALFNFGKLSYELKFDADALTALQAIQPSSNYYNEAQELLSELFLNSRDYAKALVIIENMPNKTPKIKETYQKVAYLRGLQLYQQNNKTEAKALFRKSLDNPVNQETKALATYWLGQIAHDEKDYATSTQQLNQFLTLAKNLKNLPDEASVYTANYVLGYNYLKQKNYTTAQGYFQETVAGIKRNAAFIKNDFVKRNVLGDAILRAGDCLFKRNKYDDAIKFYNEAIDGGYSGFVYAIYQKAIIEGLRGKRTEQILALERITEQYASSEYADDALLQLGKIYFEINRLNEATVPLKKLTGEYRSKSDLVNEGLILLGLISYNQGNLEVAINYYKQVFSNNPTGEEANEALKALEEIYIRDLGKTDEYFAFLETIPGYKVDDAAKDSINFRAGEAQYEGGNYEKAVQGFTAYINKFPNGRSRLTAQYHRGESYMVLKQYSNALSDFEYVISKGPSKHYQGATEKAALIAYNHEQDFTKAYNYYSLLEQNASNEQQRFEAQLGAMRSAYRVGNTNAVFQSANKVANNPNASKSQKALANLYIGKIAMDKKDFDTAREAFNKVIKDVNDESAAESRYNIAYIYYLERDLNTALSICERANRESAGYDYWIAKSVILMSDIYAEKGDLLSAKSILEALLDRYKGDPELIQIARTKKEQLDRQLQSNSRLDAGRPDNSLELDEGN